jgi:hypothetical protein
MLLRLLIIAATAVGGSVLLGRRAVTKTIQDRLPAEIDAVRTAAIAELDKHMSDVIRERLSAFGVNLCIKAGAIAFPYWLYLESHLTKTGLNIVVVALIIGFMVRDAVKTLPFVIPALILVRTHNWNPPRALTEFVAGVTFEKTYAEAIIAVETGPNRMWLALSNYSAHNLSTEVAEAVAEVTRATSYDRIKPRIILGATLAAAMMALYISFFLLTVGGA